MSVKINSPKIMQGGYDYKNKDRAVVFEKVNAQTSFKDDVTTRSMDIPQKKR